MSEYRDGYLRAKSYFGASPRLTLETVAAAWREPGHDRARQAIRATWPALADAMQRAESEAARMDPLGDGGGIMSRKPRHPHPDEVMRDAVARPRRAAEDMAPTSPDQAKTVQTIANRLDRLTRTPEPPPRGARP